MSFCCHTTVTAALGSTLNSQGQRQVLLSTRQQQRQCFCAVRQPTGLSFAQINQRHQQRHRGQQLSAAKQHYSSAGSSKQVRTHSISSTSSSNSSSSNSTSSSSNSRRQLLLASTAVLTSLASQSLCCPQQAQAYLVDETAAQSVFALAARSVVSINDYKLQSGAEILEGIGTGFVWDQYGHIVTNYHVISKYVLDKSGSQGIKVVLGDSSSEGSSSSSAGSTYTARLVGTDALHDLAVLQIDAPKADLVPIRVGTSGDLKVGQSVYAIGNPNGLSKTLTAGVVSGLNRTIPAPTGTRIYGAIQTDANINAGNSGGPLLDSFGRLVGINTASFTRSGSGRGSGVNFALPADLVRTTVPNLIIYGTASGKGVRSG